MKLNLSELSHLRRPFLGQRKFYQKYGLQVGGTSYLRCLYGLQAILYAMLKQTKGLSIKAQSDIQDQCEE